MFDSKLYLIRHKQIEEMPDYMKNFMEENASMIRPNRNKLSKPDYIDQWLDNLSDIRQNYKSGYYELIEELMDYHMAELSTAFNWIRDHFAELDMGGNYLWYGLLRECLGYIKEDNWNQQSQDTIIRENISGTRWY